MTLKQLQDKAKLAKVDGWYRMSKEQLEERVAHIESFKKQSPAKVHSKLFDAFMKYSFELKYANGVRLIGTTNGRRGVKFEGDKGRAIAETFSVAEMKKQGTMAQDAAKEA